MGKFSNLLFIFLEQISSYFFKFLSKITGKDDSLNSYVLQKYSKMRKIRYAFSFAGVLPALRPHFHPL